MSDKGEDPVLPPPPLAPQAGGDDSPPQPTPLAQRSQTSEGDDAGNVAPSASAVPAEAALPTHPHAPSSNLPSEDAAPPSFDAQSSSGPVPSAMPQSLSQGTGPDKRPVHPSPDSSEAPSEGGETGGPGPESTVVDNKNSLAVEEMQPAAPNAATADQLSLEAVASDPQALPDQAPELTTMTPELASVTDSLDRLPTEALDDRSSVGLERSDDEMDMDESGDSDAGGPGEAETDLPSTVGDGEPSQDTTPGQTASNAAIDEVSATRLASIHKEQAVLAAQYSTAASALAQALTARISATISEMDRDSKRGQDSPFFSKLYKAHMGSTIRKRPEDLSKLHKYQAKNISSNTQKNIGIIWGDFNKGQAELYASMLAELDSDFLNLAYERKAVTCADIPVNEWITNNLNVVHSLGPIPVVTSLSKTEIDGDLDALKGEFKPICKEHIDLGEYDFMPADDVPLALAPDQQRHSSLYELSNAAQAMPENPLNEMARLAQVELAQGLAKQESVASQHRGAGSGAPKPVKLPGGQAPPIQNPPGPDLTQPYGNQVMAQQPPPPPPQAQAQVQQQQATGAMGQPHQQVHGLHQPLGAAGGIVGASQSPPPQEAQIIQQMAPPQQGYLAPGPVKESKKRSRSRSRSQQHQQHEASRSPATAKASPNMVHSQLPHIQSVHPDANMSAVSHMPGMAPMPSSGGRQAHIPANSPPPAHIPYQQHYSPHQAPAQMAQPGALPHISQVQQPAQQPIYQDQYGQPVQMMQMARYGMPMYDANGMMVQQMAWYQDANGNQIPAAMPHGVPPAVPQGVPQGVPMYNQYYYPGQMVDSNYYGMAYGDKQQQQLLQMQAQAQQPHQHIPYQAGYAPQWSANK